MLQLKRQLVLPSEAEPQFFLLLGPVPFHSPNKNTSFFPQLQVSSQAGQHYRVDFKGKTAHPLAPLSIGTPYPLAGTQKIYLIGTGPKPLRVFLWLKVVNTGCWKLKTTPQKPCKKGALLISQKKFIKNNQFTKKQNKTKKQTPTDLHLFLKPYFFLS